MPCGQGVRSVAVYLLLVVALRLDGERGLAQLNAEPAAMPGPPTATATTPWSNSTTAARVRAVVIVLGAGRMPCTIGLDLSESASSWARPYVCTIPGCPVEQHDDQETAPAVGKPGAPASKIRMEPGVAARRR